MKHLMKSLMEEKADGECDKDLKAKLEVLEELRQLAKASMKHGMGDNMQKVVVAAKDKEGLQKGLGKAEELLAKSGEKSPEELSSEDDDEIEMDPEELISEHEKLVDVLRSGSEEEKQSEADDQDEELKDLLKRKLGKKA
jgi:hypothetical protein